MATNTANIQRMRSTQAATGAAQERAGWLRAQEAVMDRVFEQWLTAEREQAADDSEMEALRKRKETMSQTFREAKERKERLRKEEARALERKLFEETQKLFEEQFEEKQEEREYMEKMMTKYRNIDRDELKDMKNVVFEKKRKMQAEVGGDEKPYKWAGARRRLQLQLPSIRRMHMTR